MVITEEITRLSSVTNSGLVISINVSVRFDLIIASVLFCVISLDGSFRLLSIVWNGTPNGLLYSLSNWI